MFCSILQRITHPSTRSVTWIEFISKTQENRANRTKIWKFFDRRNKLSQKACLCGAENGLPVDVGLVGDEFL
jgi:hypothetical protein